MNKYLLVLFNNITRRIVLKRVQADSPLDVLHKAMEGKTNKTKDERVVGVDEVDELWNITRRLNLEEVAL